jgi:hypothetical protein
MNYRQKQKMKDFLVACAFIVFAFLFLFAIIYPRYLWASGEITTQEYLRMSGQTPQMIVVE